MATSGRASDRDDIPFGNVAGKYFVNRSCTDCNLCRQTAPGHFVRDDQRGYSIVYRQPQTPEEENLCRQAWEECPFDGISNDGDQDGAASRLPGKWPAEPAAVRKARTRRFFADTWCRLAVFWISRGKTEEARKHWHNCCKNLRKLGDPVLQEDLTATMRAACAKAGIAPLEDGPA